MDSIAFFHYGNMEGKGSCDMDIAQSAGSMVPLNPSIDHVLQHWQFAHINYHHRVIPCLHNNGSFATATTPSLLWAFYGKSFRDQQNTPHTAIPLLW